MEQLLQESSRWQNQVSTSDPVIGSGGLAAHMLALLCIYSVPQPAPLRGMEEKDLGHSAKE